MSVTTEAAPPTSGDGVKPTRLSGKQMLLGWALVIASMVMMCVLQREYGNLWPLAFVAVVPAIVARRKRRPFEVISLPRSLRKSALRIRPGR